jgi:autotransporter-associated beta strand protein
MSRCWSVRRACSGSTRLSRLARIAGLTAAVGLGLFAAAAEAQQSLPVSAFQTYNPANAATIVPGPFSLFTVPVDEIQPGQLNVGFSEVERKMYGWDTLTPAQIQATLLADIEPVVIGPGGILILENGHHTFTSLENSSYGATDPLVFVNVIANFSNLTTAQFWATMQADGLLLPLNDSVPQLVNTATGAPFADSLQGLTNDSYRGLEESILKNKSSKLFTTTNNITGAVGTALPGLDKLTGDYSDFLWADIYRNANGGLGLPYLSSGDIALAANYNLNPNSVSTLPNIGTVTLAQIPGFILEQNITVSSTISNATLSTGTLAGNGTFTGITQFNLGTPTNQILVGTPQSGFVMQLGFDAGFSVTLNAANTYTGGTTIIAGNLIVAGGAGGAPIDAALGAAPTPGFTINPNNILASVEAANGIIFNSEDEGMGQIQFGSSSGNGTNTAANQFSTNRPIAVDGETATLNLNGYFVTLNGPIVSLGTFGTGLGNESGVSNLTIEDTSSGGKGVLFLPGTANNSLFYGDWIITSGTLNVSSDASLGNTTGPAYEIGQIELNGGTLQAGASFASVRSLFLGGSSTFDTNGYTTSWSGALTDVQRTLTIENSNTSGTNAVGNVTFGSLAAGATATIALNAGSGSSGGPGTIVTFTNGITRNGDTDAGAPANATVFIDPATGSNLGVSGTNGVQVFSSGASTALTNGIVPVWIITDSGGSASSNPYNFLTYSSTSGYTIAATTATFGASNVVKVSSNQTLSANTQAYALNLQNGKTITIGSSDTLTIGNGSNPAGLILEGTTTISGGTLAFGASEAVIDVKATNTISSKVTGTGGLTLSGSGTLVLSGTAGGLSGPITVDSGTLQLNTANFFPTTGGGTTVWLSNVKSSPSAAILTVDASNVISALNSDGNNSTVNIATGVTLTIGDSNNLSSTLSSTIAGTGTGSLVKAGTGLLDISGSGGVSFGTGGSVTVDAGALRIGNGVFKTSATTPISVAAGAELQYSGNSGSVFNDPISGAGVFHLVGGVVQLTSTSNTYSGGTVLEVGTTLDVTTANLPANTRISNAGGILLFDQSTTGTFTGVMSDGQQAGGPNNPNDMSCTLVTCTTGTLSGTLIKDDSTTGFGGNVTIANQQAYSGMTYIEAGTLTLGTTNTIIDSAGVDLGRVGGAVCNPSPCSGVTASLALLANNTISGLEDNPANSTSVILNGHTLTLAPVAGSSWTYAGSIVDGSATGGSLVQNGPGTTILTGTSTYTGTTAIDAGILEVNGSITSSSAVTVNSGGTLIGTGTIDPPTMTIASGGTFAPGTPGVPGTFMTVAGNLAFAPGAMYLVQLNGTASTYANVTGTASLAGTVFASFASGTVPQKQYTILISSGLGGTTFSSVTTNLPSNFSPSLSYTNNDTDVVLNLTAVLGFGAGLNANQQNVANAINNFFNDGPLPANFANLFGLTGANLQNALTQLSGEAATGAEHTAFQLTTEFLGLMLNPFVDGRAGPGSAVGGPAIGFAPEEQANLPPDVALAYASILTKAPPPKQPAFDQRWVAWGSSYGGASLTNGDPTTGSNTLTAQTFGFAAGLDYHFTPDTLAGVALAGGGTGWSLANGLGGGRSDAFQAGAYGMTRAGPTYLAAAVAFTNHWMSTSRNALGDELTARFDAQSYGGRVEAGYRYAVTPTLVATPYAAIQAQEFQTPNYSETDVTGLGFALSYAAMHATDTRSELGARFDAPTLLWGMPFILRSRLAWAYDWVSTPALGAVFQALPGASFVVNGAPIPHNSALTSAGAQLFLSANWSVLAQFDGEFANGSQTYAGSATLRYAW